MDKDPGEVTLLLRRANEGDSGAAEELLPVVYEELRRLAGSYMRRESANQTIQATALVHEAYLRLVGSSREQWNDHRHFFHAAAMAMRRTLLDRAKAKRGPKRNPGGKRVGLDSVELPVEQLFDSEQFEALDRLLSELADHNQRWADVLHMRLYLGLTVEQTASMLGVSAATVKNDWRFALAWLRVELKKLDPEPGLAP